MLLSRLLSFIVTTGLLAGCSADESTDLDALLRCNDTAIGGDALRALKTVASEVRIEEPGFTATGKFVASRLGRMRIDVYIDGNRVFSEGYNGQSAWQLPGGATEIEPASDDGTAALRHSVEQPGHLWTLRDMQTRGHTVTMLERETIGDIEYFVVELTLDDSFQIWYWLNPDNCFIERNRNFRAFHPDIDPEKTWTETVFEDFRETDGITRAWLVKNVDMGSGEIMGTTTVLKVTSNPDLDDSLFSGN